MVGSAARCKEAEAKRYAILCATRPAAICRFGGFDPLLVGLEELREEWLSEPYLKNSTKWIGERSVALAAEQEHHSALVVCAQQKRTELTNARSADYWRSETSEFRDRFRPLPSSEWLAQPQVGLVVSDANPNVYNFIA